MFCSRLQLEERLAQEARERTEKRYDDKRLSTEELRKHNDIRKSPNVEDRRRDQVHFVLGGDK